MQHSVDGALQLLDKKRVFGPMAQTAGRTALAQRRAIMQKSHMAIVLIFMLGIGNFALHKAVMQSGHPLLGQVPWFANGGGQRVAFALEFIVLLAALLLAANGWPSLAWGYLVYSVFNGMSAWLILTGKV